MFIPHMMMCKIIILFDAKIVNQTLILGLPYKSCVDNPMIIYFSKNSYFVRSNATSKHRAMLMKSTCYYNL